MHLGQFDTVTYRIFVFYSAFRKIQCFLFLLGIRGDKVLVTHLLSSDRLMEKSPGRHASGQIVSADPGSLVHFFFCMSFCLAICPFLHSSTPLSLLAVLTLSFFLHLFLSFFFFVACHRLILHFSIAVFLFRLTHPSLSLSHSLFISF